MLWLAWEGIESGWLAQKEVRLGNKIRLVDVPEFPISPINVDLYFFK